MDNSLSSSLPPYPKKRTHVHANVVLPSFNGEHLFDVILYKISLVCICVWMCYIEKLGEKIRSYSKSYWLLDIVWWTWLHVRVPKELLLTSSLHVPAYDKQTRMAACIRAPVLCRVYLYASWARETSSTAWPEPSWNLLGQAHVSGLRKRISTYAYPIQEDESL